MTLLSGPLVMYSIHQQLHLDLVLFYFVCRVYLQSIFLGLLARYTSFLAP